MKKIASILCLVILSACSTVPNAHITTRAERIVVTHATKVHFDSGPVLSVGIFDLPAGTYSVALENKHYVYYVVDGAEIRKTWTLLNRGRVPPRSRPGGLLLDKGLGIWRVFTLGPSSDLRDDRFPELGILLADKIGDKFANWGGVIGRTDEHGKLVTMEDESWGRIDDLSAFVFEGNVPILEK